MAKARRATQSMYRGKMAGMQKPVIISTIVTSTKKHQVLIEYCINPEDQTCKWACFDIDCHENFTPEKDQENLAKVDELSRRLRERGIEPLIECSNGKGGYHVWVFFTSPVPARDLYFFVREIAKGIEGIECNPKQKTA